ncbi:MAG TPA: response regulator transcription factor [Candidatus Dormibacteraeota bacterium]|nr:response regulator transcription factor [Candidatus Dormibacteraeota bacterium]
MPRPDDQPSDQQPPLIRVLVVVNHPVLATEIVEILKGEPGLCVCGVARTGADAVLLTKTATGQRRAHGLPPAGHDRRRGRRHHQDHEPRDAIIFQSADESETDLLDAIDAGASAYLTKSSLADQIVEAVRRAGQGEVLIPVALFAKAIARQRRVIAEAAELKAQLAAFTARELEVLRLLARGLDTSTIARQLSIAEHTVEWHVRHVIEKLHVHSKLQAVVTAARLGIIDL